MKIIASDTVRMLIGRGLAAIAGDLMLSADIAHRIGADCRTQTRFCRSTIREALLAIDKQDRAWALSWLRAGVKAWRESR